MSEMSNPNLLCSEQLCKAYLANAVINAKTKLFGEYFTGLIDAGTSLNIDTWLTIIDSVSFVYNFFYYIIVF
jgi:hypothetical protein